MRDNRLVESVDWARLTRVAVHTSDEGPFQEDFYWLLVQEDGKGAAVPQTWEGSARLLEALQKLPGFDNQAFVSACTSVQPALFECWKGKPGEAAGPMATAYRNPEVE
jgi:hypothetical protein